MDIAKLFARCAKEIIEFPKFVIFDPQEVPASRAEVGACVISTVNEMRRQFSGFLERYNQVPIPWHPGKSVSDGNQPNPAPDRLSPLPYSVVLKNPHPPTTTPEERKQFLMSMCGEDLSVDDFELKRSRSERRLLVKTKFKANSIASSIN